MEAFSSGVENAMEEGYVLDTLRQVRKLLSIQAKGHEHLTQGSGSRDGNLRKEKEEDSNKMILGFLSDRPDSW